MKSCSPRCPRPLNCTARAGKPTTLRSRQQRLSADLDQPFGDLIGEAPILQEVFQTMAKVAATDASVLILGENGTGKELVAREIHRRSARADEVFISVDMGSLSETLFESELFGHVKGAFTDARSDRAGRFEIASGGTLFLDEIGNLPLSLQVKLLAALQKPAGRPRRCQPARVRRCASHLRHQPAHPRNWPRPAPSARTCSTASTPWKSIYPPPARAPRRHRAIGPSLPRPIPDQVPQDSDWSDRRGTRPTCARTLGRAMCGNCSTR